MPRFELGTSCTPSRRATRLRYIPSGTIDSLQSTLKSLLLTFCLRSHFLLGRRRWRDQAQFGLLFDIL